MEGYWTIAIIALLAAISPGPDFVVVAQYALAGHRRGAMMVSLGVGAGVLVHVSYCVLGLAVVIAHSVVLFRLIQYCGAAYLIYLGVKGIFSGFQASSFSQRKVQDVSSWRGFRVGLLTNVLNPKCSLFLLSIFTLVVKPQTPLWVQWMYGLELMVITLLWFMGLSYGLTGRRLQLRLLALQPLICRIMGVVLIGLALVVLLEGR